MAKGSHATWSGYPRECHANCGLVPRITRDTLWLETVKDEQGRWERRTWHFACRPRKTAKVA